MLGLRRDVTTERNEEGKMVTCNMLTQTAYVGGVHNRWEKMQEDAGKPILKKVPTYPMHTKNKYAVVKTPSVPKRRANRV